MIDETPQKTDAYDIVRQRLHLAKFRTVVIPAHATLSPKSVVDMLDQLKVAGGLLVGDGPAANWPGVSPPPNANDLQVWW